MYQPLLQQESSTTMNLQPTGPGPVQPGDFYIISPVFTKCESYAHSKSMIAGIILIIAGALAFILNVVGLAVHINEIVPPYLYGIWCGVLVSWLIRL